MTTGPDTNINRSTSSQFIDTIIAPFELDADARQQSGGGVTGSARGYSLDNLGGVQVLSSANFRRRSLQQVAVRRHPAEPRQRPGIQSRKGHDPAAALYERRWYGGDPYSNGVGGDLDAELPLTTRTQLAFSASSGPPDDRSQQRSGRMADRGGRRSAPAIRRRATLARILASLRQRSTRPPGPKAFASSARIAARARDGARHNVRRARLHPHARDRGTIPVRQDAARPALGPDRRRDPQRSEARRLLADACG